MGKGVPVTVKSATDIPIEVLSQIGKAVGSEFSSMRYELDEHLDSINQNTNEIQAQEDFLLDVNGRMDKLEEKMTDIQLMLRQIISRSMVSIELSREEQKVFLVLYTHDHHLTLEQISERCGMDSDSTSSIVSSLMDKGLPLDKVFRREDDAYKMEENFKRMQARDQIVKIDLEVTQQFQNKLLARFFEM